MQRIFLIIAIALITYSTRLIGFQISNASIPSWLRLALDYVPIAIFAAIATSGFQTPAGASVARLGGALCAILAVLLLKKSWLGLFAGLIGFWCIQFLLLRA